MIELIENTHIGTVIATNETPSATQFHFIISEEAARSQVESGSFIQSQQHEELVFGVIESLRRVNRYYSSAEMVHGTSQFSVSSIYPSEQWDYILAQVKVLGRFRDGIQQRSTRPVLPGSNVEFADEIVLKKLLGLADKGLEIGTIRQTNMKAIISIDRLLQKHLAILSISGGGKSYTTAVIMEELLKRKAKDGRPCIVVFDIHGEYKRLNNISSHPLFKHTHITRISANELSLAMGHISSSDLRKFFPTMSFAQTRELEKIIYQLRVKQEPITLEGIISKIYETEMNQLVKDALLGWLNMLKNMKLFGNIENPDLEKNLQAGRVIIFDFSPLTKLWKKRVIMTYLLTRIFNLRRFNKIPPVISVIEEAHQFAPEVEASACKPIIHTIAREGRKFLCSMILISQRPSNLSTTALSQCNSHLILRILNPNDLAWIGKSSEGINQETLGMITTLGVGEGLLVGEAVNYPVFIQIREKLVKADFDETSIWRESLKYEKIII